MAVLGGFSRVLGLMTLLSVPAFVAADSAHPSMGATLSSAIAVNRPVLLTPGLATLGLEDTNGKTVDLSSYDNQRVALYFWSIYCRSCVPELKRLEALEKQFEERGVKVITVHLFEKDRAKVISRTSELDVSSPLVFGSAELRDALDVRMLPTVLLFDKEHRLTQRFDGDKAVIDFRDTLLK